MSNEKKAATLGMPHGTANGRLRKIILFHLLKKLNENICFKCSQVIDKVEDLSIEHKQPWEGRSADLFWDLDNIAFSHLICNRPHRNYPENLGAHVERYVGPEGTAWCSGHLSFLPVVEFYEERDRWNHCSVYCKKCNSEKRKTYKGR
jgi:hypothetical protein